MPPPESKRLKDAVINYVFGTLPPSPPQNNTVDWGAARPLYMLVQESTPRPALNRVFFGYQDGYWVFAANFHGRNLDVYIMSNEPSWMVKRVGQRLLRLARSGRG